MDYGVLWVLKGFYDDSIDEIHEAILCVNTLF
jgi:hypothetical protein